MAFACCLGGEAVAQTSTPPPFVRLDKNGDGKVTREEAPSAESFAAADANKDVAVTLDEFRRHLGRRPNQATAPKTPDSVSQPATNQSGLFALLQRMPIALNVKQVPAYNEFTPFTRPDDGSTLLLCGLWVWPHGWDKPPNNGSWFLIRGPDGRYQHQPIYDSAHVIPEGQSLGACRTITLSPFPEDGGRALYFGGYDAGGGKCHNTAWIYRGEIQSIPEKNSKP